MSTSSKYPREAKYGKLFEQLTVLTKQDALQAAKIISCVLCTILSRGEIFSKKALKVDGHASKFAKATEKDPDVQCMKAELISSLEQAGDYKPSYDELVVTEIAKTIVDIRRIDGRFDAAKSLPRLKAAWTIKASMLQAVQSLMDQLAMNRKGRISRRDLQRFEDTMNSRLLSLLSQKSGKVHDSA